MLEGAVLLIHVAHDGVPTELTPPFLLLGLRSIFRGWIPTAVDVLHAMQFGTTFRDASRTGTLIVATNPNLRISASVPIAAGLRTPYAT